MVLILTILILTLKCQHMITKNEFEVLLKKLPSTTSTLFNPWTSSCPYDSIYNTTESKKNRLYNHLNCDAKYILVGEAPGYQGCRYSGVAFTSERLLLEGAIPRINRLEDRLTSRPRPFSEPSATIVWATLKELGIAEETILWNALQMHPHPISEIWKNRTPLDIEISQGAEAVKELIKLNPTAKIIAVGKKAEFLLNKEGIKTHGCVRHPANGGATLFRSGLQELMSS